MQAKSLQIENIIFNIKHSQGFRSDKELADALGVTAATISNWKRRGTIDRDLVLSKLEVPAEMLFSGDLASSHQAPKSNAQFVKNSVSFTATTVKIKFYPQNANAGLGVPLDAPTPFEREVDASLIDKPEDGFCMFASGDSMVYAGILDGSFLVCTRVRKDWRDLIGQIVVANRNGVTLVKRLVEEEGTLRLRSESPKRYKDIPLTEDAPAVLQGVVLSVHTDIKNYKPKL